jgi:hypothetical protein
MPCDGPEERQRAQVRTSFPARERYRVGRPNTSGLTRFPRRDRSKGAAEAAFSV